MRPQSGAQYKHVEGLTRGLAVLRALNRAGSGRATAAQISQETGLHRTTVRRLLETLLSDGCVRRSSSDESYRLTLKARDFSEGFTDVEWVSEIAAPVLGELLQQVVWPSDLGTLDGDAMIIRETNHRFSSLSFHRKLVGRRLPLLNTSMGKAYLAFCSADERELLLQLIATGNDEQSEFARDRRNVEAILNKVQAEGVATNNGEWKEESHVGAIALPIRHEGRVLACLNVVFLRRALTVEQAKNRYLSSLVAAVNKIEGKCAAKLAS